MIRQHAANEPMEGQPVLRFRQVSQLVDDDEVDEVRWKLKDRPVEHNPAVYRALPPSLAETVDPYPGRSDTKASCPVRCAVMQPHRPSPAIPPDDRRGYPAWLVAHGEQPITSELYVFVGIVDDDKPAGPSEVGEVLTLHDLLRGMVGGDLRLTVGGADHPRQPRLDRRNYLRRVSVARNGDCERAAGFRGKSNRPPPFAHRDPPGEVTEDAGVDKCAGVARCVHEICTTGHGV